MVAVASLVPVLHLALDPASAVRALPMARIVQEVREVWQPYLNIVWGNGPETLASGPSLGVLITDAAPPSHGERGPSLGWIEFFGDGQPADRIAVSISSVETMIETGTWLGRPLKTLPPDVRRDFIARALGRAIAHEIGHFVLRSKAHQPAGLMRARFTVSDLMDGRRSHVRLTPSEQRELASAFTDRIATMPVASAAPASPQTLF